VNPTHDPRLTSWVTSAQAQTDFPIQNLPFGVFRRAGSGDSPRVGIAIGDQILDLSASRSAAEYSGRAATAADACGAPTLNRLMSLGAEHWSALRAQVSAFLAADSPAYRADRGLGRQVLVPVREAELFLPAQIGDYSDFYASLHHATNVGSMFRPDNPLLPNYKWVPIGYHGRASSIVVSGTPVKRPHGQLKPTEAESPVFAPSRALDYVM
jgi:fumarylacetoacetase